MYGRTATFGSRQLANSSTEYDACLVARSAAFKLFARIEYFGLMGLGMVVVFRESHVKLRVQSLVSEVLCTSKYAKL